MIGLMAGLLSSTPDARPMCSATARHAVIGFQHDRAPRPSCSSSGARAQDGCGRGCMRGTIAAASPPRDGVAMASDQQTIFKYTQVELDTKPGWTSLPSLSSVTSDFSRTCSISTPSRRNRALQHHDDPSCSLSNPARRNRALQHHADHPAGDCRGWRARGLRPRRV